MTDYEELPRCILCQTPVSPDDSVNFEHHEFNFVSLVLGRPVLCAECWRRLKTKGGDN